MLPGTLEALLAPTAQAEVVSVLTSGGALTKKPTGEITSVRTMVLDGFDQIATAWNPTLRSHGYQARLQAVFCHSRPQVTFPRVPSPHAPSLPKPGRCELADLLVVIDHIDPWKAVKDRRAILIQAKILTGSSIKPSKKEWIQHELLAWLPAFDFIDPGYVKKTRDFVSPPTVGVPANSAEYGGIDLTSATVVWNQWLTSTTKPYFISPADFGPFLAGMAVGRLQYGREAIDGGSDDWSFTVDELLKVTAAHAIVKRTPTIKRGVSHYVGFLIDAAPVSDWFRAGAPPFEGEGIDWPEGPISTVHLTFERLG